MLFANPVRALAQVVVMGSAAWLVLEHGRSAAIIAARAIRYNTIRDDLQTEKLSRATTCTSIGFCPLTTAVELLEGPFETATPAQPAKVDHVKHLLIECLSVWPSDSPSSGSRSPLERWSGLSGAEHSHPSLFAVEQVRYLGERSHRSLLPKADAG
jgi:hypothetical protein